MRLLIAALLLASLPAAAQTRNETMTAQNTASGTTGRPTTISPLVRKPYDDQRRKRGM